MPAERSSFTSVSLIDTTAELGADVSVGPYCVIGPKVIVGDRCSIAGHTVIERNTRIGEGVKLGFGTIIGNDPQDLKYKGEETWVEIGSGTIIREYCTINRGSSATGKTTSGRRAPSPTRAGPRRRSYTPATRRTSPFGHRSCRRA